MNLVREGLVLIAVAAGLSALGFLAAVVRRSFSLWLFAILLLIVTLVVAYLHRGSAHRARGARAAHFLADAHAATIPRGRVARIHT